MKSLKNIRLVDAGVGVQYKICDFDAKDVVDKRLVDLGFVLGARLSVVGKSFFNTTFAIKLKNSVLCIRKEQAEKIWVTL